ncbi:MAG: phosphoadenylyl-sulfate reductase [Cryomorphaceae bacterium]|nr:MAG: phosphoadenylyl-sulfate reductase [Cryomorphaceae bacterium]
MKFEEIQSYLQRYTEEGKKCFVTSSFQSHSLPLLHMLSRMPFEIPVLFINTGFHFPETLTFRDEVVETFGLKMIDVESLVNRIDQRDQNGHFYFTSDPDRCCYINKTQPLEPFLMAFDVWINGVRADQNANRRNMQTEQEAPHSVTRFHPILDWTARMIHEYAKEHELPRHPLEDQGYLSVGCEPCTRKTDLHDDRSGRWFGMQKTECGLHTDLIKPS